MNTRAQTGIKDLNFYTNAMNKLSNYTLSRPADGAIDASHNLIMGMGKSHPFETHGMSLVDTESAILNRGVVLGKSGHTPASFGSTVMQAAGANQPVPMFSIPRFEYSARDSKSAPMPPTPAMPINDVQPVLPNIQTAGISSRAY